MVDGRDIQFEPRRARPFREGAPKQGDDLLLLAITEKAARYDTKRGIHRLLLGASPPAAPGAERAGVRHLLTTAGFGHYAIQMPVDIPGHIMPGRPRSAVTRLNSSGHDLRRTAERAELPADQVGA
jgi:hypothetical protein